MAIRDLDAAQESYEDVLEDMIELLHPERRVRGVPPEQRLAGVPPEQRLAGLDRDQRALALPLDVLQALSEEYLRTLSPEVEEQLRQRLRAAGD
jgi:hypothetical protein